MEKILKMNKKYVRSTTRFTYKNKGEIQESNPVFLGSELIVIQIDKKTKEYKMVDLKTNKICFSSGKGKSMEEAKRKARDILIKNSASVYEEVRKKK